MSWFEGDDCSLVEPDYHDVGNKHIQGDYREEMRILNCTGRMIQIRHRSTVISCHPSRDYKGLPQGLYVVKDIYCRSGTVGSASQLTFEQLPEEEQQKYFDLDNESNILLGEINHTRISYRYELSDIEGRDGVYCQKLDLVFSLNKDPNRIPNHPASIEYVFDRMIVEDPEVNSRSGSILKITIVDNQKLFGDRYLNVEGMIIEIKAIQDYRLKDGVYLVRSNYMETDANGTFTNRVEAPSGVHYTFDDISNGKFPFTLWVSKQEALMKGDKVRELKAEAELIEKKRAVKELESSLAVFKAQNDSLREEYEKERLEREKEFEEEKRKLEADKMRRANYYDDLSHSRKESSEFLKFLPIILGGIALFSKL